MSSALEKSTKRQQHHQRLNSTSSPSSSSSYSASVSEVATATHPQPERIPRDSHLPNSTLSGASRKLAATDVRRRKESASEESSIESHSFRRASRENSRSQTPPAEPPGQLEQISSPAGAGSSHRRGRQGVSDEATPGLRSVAAAVASSSGGRGAAPRWSPLTAPIDLAQSEKAGGGVLSGGPRGEGLSGSPFSSPPVDEVKIQRIGLNEVPNKESESSARSVSFDHVRDGSGGDGLTHRTCAKASKGFVNVGQQQPSGTAREGSTAHRGGVESAGHFFRTWRQGKPRSDTVAGGTNESDTARTSVPGGSPRGEKSVRLDISGRYAVEELSPLTDRPRSVDGNHPDEEMRKTKKCLSCSEIVIRFLKAEALTDLEIEGPLAAETAKAALSKWTLRYASEKDNRALEDYSSKQLRVVCLFVGAYFAIITCLQALYGVFRLRIGRPEFTVAGELVWIALIVLRFGDAVMLSVVGCFSASSRFTERLATALLLVGLIMDGALCALFTAISESVTALWWCDFHAFFVVVQTSTSIAAWIIPLPFLTVVFLNLVALLILAVTSVIHAQSAFIVVEQPALAITVAFVGTLLFVLLTLYVKYTQERVVRILFLTFRSFRNKYHRLQEAAKRDMAKGGSTVEMVIRNLEKSMKLLTEQRRMLNSQKRPPGSGGATSVLGADFSGNHRNLKNGSKAGDQGCPLNQTSELLEMCMTLLRNNPYISPQDLASANNKQLELYLYGADPNIRKSRKNDSPPEESFRYHVAPSSGAAAHSEQFFVKHQRLRKLSSRSRQLDIPNAEVVSSGGWMGWNKNFCIATPSRTPSSSASPKDFRGTSSTADTGPAVAAADKAGWEEMELSDAELSSKLRLTSDFMSVLSGNSRNNNTPNLMDVWFTKIPNSLVRRMDHARKFVPTSEDIARNTRICQKELLNNSLRYGIGVDWNHSMLRVSSPLVTVGFALLKPLLHQDALRCSEDCVVAFLAALQDLYGFENPYHMAAHGATVAHAAMSLARMLYPSSPRQGMTDMEKSILVIAALAHDVGHPGRNNAFLINSFNSVAAVYNDKSVLENYHCSLAFGLLADVDIFVELTDADFQSHRKAIIDYVLATDMVLHFDTLSNFRIRKAAADFDPTNKAQDKTMVVKMIMKAADLSHASFTWPVHREWSIRCNEEFWRQGDEEMRLGIAVSPLCDRSKCFELAKGQVGFLTYVVMPLFVEIEEVDETGAVRDLIIAGIQENQNRWKQLDESGASPFFEDAADDPTTSVPTDANVLLFSQ